MTLSYQQRKAQKFDVGQYVCVVDRRYTVNDYLYQAIGKIIRTDTLLGDADYAVQFPVDTSARFPRGSNIHYFGAEQLRPAHKCEGDIAFWNPEDDNKRVFGTTDRIIEKAKKVEAIYNASDF